MSPEELRVETLSRLEELMTAMVERYGRRTTLGEMLAIVATLKRLCRQDQVTLAELADATGLPKQSLSRWAQKRIGDSILLRINEDDQRMNDVVLMDSERGQRQIEIFARILGVTD